MTFKQKFYVQTLTAFLASFLAVAAVSFVLIGKIRTLREEYKKNQFSILNDRARQAHYDTLKKNHLAASWPVEKLERLLINKNNPLNFIVQAEALAKQFNLQYNIRFAGETAAEGKTAHLIFQITASGDYANFMRFLDSFENMPFFMQVEKIQISAAANTGVKGSFKVKIYAK